MESVMLLHSKYGIKNLHHFFIPIPFCSLMYIHNPCLKLNPNPSPYLSLRSSPRPTFNPNSQEGSHIHDILWCLKKWPLT